MGESGASDRDWTAQIRSERGRVGERDADGGAMAGIGPTSSEFVDTTTPHIIGPNKIMGRERGVR